jgi:hypothetical protein
MNKKEIHPKLAQFARAHIRARANCALILTDTTTIGRKKNMKKPTLKGWMAIIGAVLAVVLAVIAAVKDGDFSADEAKQVSEKIGEAVEVIQVETAE